MRAELSSRVVSAKRELDALLHHPLATTLSAERLAEFSATYRSALERLETIQRTLAQSRDLRKQKLLAYKEEIQELLSRAKGKITRTVAA